MKFKWKIDIINNNNNLQYIKNANVSYKAQYKTFATIKMERASAMKESLGDGVTGSPCLNDYK